MEIWKDIYGYKGMYQVSNWGRVRSLLTDCIKRQKIDRYGYYVVTLYHKKYRVHRLVALAFCAGYADGLQVSHKDENKLNNFADNLEWVTQKENNNMPRHRERLCAGKGTAVLQLDNDLQFIASFDSIEQAARATGVNHHTIRKDIIGIPRRQSKFVWRKA